MTSSISIPVSENLYVEILHFLEKKGVKRPVSSVIGQLIEYGLENAEWKTDLFFPEIAKSKSQSKIEGYKWKHPQYRKALFLPNKTQLKMEYPSGTNNFALIEDGNVIYRGQRFKSPSQLANHIAQGTARSAPRDLFIKRPHDLTWKQALEFFKELNN